MAITKTEFEGLIIDALGDAGDLMTLGAENGVEIDSHGPREKNETTVRGWFIRDGERSFFSATVTVTLDEFQPDYGDDDWDIEGDEDDDDE